jgi:hypothetical protein
MHLDSVNDEHASVLSGGELILSIELAQTDEVENVTGGTWSIIVLEQCIILDGNVKSAVDE